MATNPIVRISRGHFPSTQYDEVRRFNEAAAESLVPAIKQLRGLLYYHVAVDPVTNTVVNVSIWTDLDAARQMETLSTNACFACTVLKGSDTIRSHREL